MERLKTVMEIEQALQQCGVSAEKWPHGLTVKERRTSRTLFGGCSGISQPRIPYKPTLASYTSSNTPV
jgi:hypothetical protein